jgi:hypothetical protein
MAPTYTRRDKSGVNGYGRASILVLMLSTAEPKCAKWRRESVPVELREKCREALAS